MPSSMTPASDAGSNKKQIALTPEQAKNKLALIKQGAMSVPQYFDECHRLCNIISGKPVDVQTDITLLAAFKNGLNDNIRNIVNLAPITDAVTARMVAGQEEMFLSFAKLRDRDGKEDRIHKMELLHFMGWEKMRNFEQQFLDVNRKLDNASLENKCLKEMVVALTESQKEQAATATDHFQKLQAEIRANAPTTKNEEFNDALSEARLEIKDLKEMVVALSQSQKEVQMEQRDTATDHTHRLLAEIKTVGDAAAAENAKKIEMEDMRNQLDTIGRSVDTNYEWIVAIHRGLDKANKKLDDTAAATITPNDETPISIPNATPPPLFPTKRSHSSDEDEDDVPIIEHKRSRTVTATEEAVLEEMKKVLSGSKLEAIKNENMMDEITKLYEEYSSRIDEVRRWMGPVRNVDKRCCLCHSRRHHAHECDKVRTVEERKRVMRKEAAFCMTCTNFHGGWCRGLSGDCWLCVKAAAAGRLPLAGAYHARMWCPLQEQFFKDEDMVNKLFKAKKQLSESAQGSG